MSIMQFTMQFASGVARKPIQQRRQHIIAKMKFKLLDRSKMFLARRTAGLNDLVLGAHERGQVVLMNFSLEYAE